MNKPLSIIILALLLIAVVLYWVGESIPTRPAKDGAGPLAIQLDPNIPAPTTHSPLEWWQLNHPNVVNSGDLREKDCLYCHNPDKSCNSCHGYVGVRTISQSGTQ